MRLNYYIIKKCFSEYLEQHSNIKLEDNDNLSSIFKHNDELKTFLSEKYDIDWSEISINFEDLLSNSIKDGKFVLDDEAQNAEFDELEDAELDELDFDKEDFDMEDFLLGYINEFINDEEVKELIDKNNDDEISKKEILNFLKGINGEDDDKETLSLDDIELKYSDIKENSANLSNVLSEDKPDASVDSKTINNPPSANSANKSKNRSGGNNYNGGNDYTGGDNTEPQDKNNLQTMSVSDLTNLQNETKTKLSGFQDDLNKALSGDGENANTLKEDYNKAKTDYEEAIKNDEALSELKDKSLKNTADIESAQSNLASIQLEQNQNDINIFTLESEINGYTSRIETLTSTKAELSLEKDDTKAKEARNNISKIETQISDLTSKKEKAQKELEALNNKKEKLAKDYTKQSENLANLQTQKAQIDSDILNNENVNESTKTALNNFNEAKANLEKAKSDDISSIKSNIETTKAELNKISEAIKTRQAEDDKREYSVSGDLFTKAGYTIQTMTCDETGQTYSIAVPADYDPNKKYPAITWLSGLGQKGTNIEKLYNGDLGKALKENPDSIGFNGIFIMYQTPDGNAKDEVGNIREVTKDAMKKFNIDNKNVAIGGHSEGSNGVLACAMKNDEFGNKDGFKFSSALICSGVFINGDMSKINIPVFGVSGRADYLYKTTSNVVARLDRNHEGGRFIEIQGGHDVTATKGFQVKGSDGEPILLKKLFPEYS